ncbi:putative mannose-sensitive agglutinin (MSHA) biogenesis protein MshI [Sideroxydans lithotrophicus ES-1]|uniref:Putative mannose-sensitive agglutinin (MSHA) biogenesis protein MshI n=1 Tax=Sideroxydans lithotrophicus (strain ES-1) TaxID=580332 RepID=D5CNC5_SIDLE|nr:putative mannose-sensitive agglutinin (MSHA) biogenesis protein MshI [Sideroxydans lithotrophicus ES-1]
MEIPQFLKLFKRNSRDGGWVALTTGKRGVHVAQIKFMGSRPQVTKCAFYPLAEMSATALEKVRKDVQLGDARFTTLLSASEYQLMMVDAPNVPVNELKTAIRWKIKDSLNYHVDDATIDVLQIPSSKYGSDRPQSLYAVAASNETIRKRIELFEKARIELNVIDIPETAQRNIAMLFEMEGRGLAMLTFGDDGGLLTITCDGELFLARRIEVTFGQLQDADENLCQQYQDRVELEVQRSLDYFDRQFHHIPVNRILLSAPASVGLDKLLTNSLGMSVEMLDLAQGMDIFAVPELADSEFASYALPALGAALRQEKKTL